MDYLTSVGKTTTAYTDNNVTNGTTYYYTISASDVSGNQSQRSAQVSATVTTYKPSVPQNVTATAQPGAILIAWNKNPETNVTYYRLFRGTSSNYILTYKWISSSQNYYQDSDVVGGATYYYQVRSYNNLGYYSDYSPIVSATAITNKPSVPQNVTATAQPGAILLTWNANPENDITNYWIYKGTNNSNIPPLGSVSSSETSYIDYNVIFGTTYYYQVAAKNDEAYVSDLSSIVSASPLTKNVTITNPTISTNINKEALLQWDLNTEPWINHYKIFRGTTSGYSFLASVINGTSTYIDKNLTSGNTYYYKILACDSQSNVWGEVKDVSIKIWSPPISMPFSITINEDNSYQFKDTDFYFYDADNHSATDIIITTPPTVNVNTIKYANSNLFIGESITNVSNLNFVPESNDNGLPYTNFRYKVKDSSGHLSDTDYLVTLNVNPVNDLPSGFTLQLPDENNIIEINRTNLLHDFCEFKWTASTDIDGDQVLYNLIFNGDLDFLTRRGLTETSIQFDHSYICDNLDTETPINSTWVVEATDGTGITSLIMAKYP